MKRFSILSATAAMATAMLAQPASATAYDIMATYYLVKANGKYTAASGRTPASHTGGDFYAPTVTTNPFGGGTTVTGLPQAVESHVYDMVSGPLGPNGRPVLTSGYNSTNPPLTINDVNANTGELQWWTPGTTAGGSVITLDGQEELHTNDAGRYDNTSFFDSIGSSSDGYFRTAILSGTISLDVLSSVTFALGGDDDVFLYVDGALILQDAGIHGYTNWTIEVKDLIAGDHVFEMFYADRNATNAAIHFQILTEGLEVTPTTPPDTPPPPGGTPLSAVPEPATWAMMIAGFGLVGATMRRRHKVADALA